MFFKLDTPTAAPITTSANATSTNSNSSTTQPIPVPTLVGVCVGAFVLVALIVIFVIWFGARSRKKKLNENTNDHSNINGLDYMKHSLGGMDGTPGSPRAVHLKGLTANGNSSSYGAGAPLKAGSMSEPSSYYSQHSTALKPSQTVTHYNQQPSRHPTADSFDQQQPVYTIPADYNAMSDALYADEPSFLPKENVYTRNDMAPASPRSATVAVAPAPLPPPDAPSQSSPRSQSTQTTVRPYAAGAHPYASSHTQNVSIEHQGGYTIATALPEPETVGLGPSGRHYSNSPAFSNPSAHASISSAINGTFAQAGARPGYDAYGIEPKQPPPPTHSHSRTNSFTQQYAQQAGRQPIQNITARPSLESIRSIARKASVDRTALEVATDFVLGGPQAVGTSRTRSRNNSLDGSLKGLGMAAGSTYAGSGPGYSSSLYSSRSGKEGKGGKGDKEKISKSEKKREMKAMDNLIAALDESAVRERRRKEALAEAAGLGSSTTSDANRGKSNAGEESDLAVPSRRRRDVAITGSFPLPPPDVFRAALVGAGRGKESEPDEIDDEEIERWRRR